MDPPLQEISFQQHLEPSSTTTTVSDSQQQQQQQQQHSILPGDLPLLPTSTVAPMNTQTGASSAMMFTVEQALKETNTYDLAHELGFDQVVHGQQTTTPYGAPGTYPGNQKPMMATAPRGGYQPNADINTAAIHMATQLAESSGKKAASAKGQTKAENAQNPSQHDTKPSAAPAPQEKGSKGLRHFSLKVCEKVEKKGRTTYNEVADELVLEFATPDAHANANGEPVYDEKNIRRRVYDALNVLMAMDIISKDKKKEILWKGLPSASQGEIEHLRSEKIRAASRIEKKKQYLKELEEQLEARRALIARNAASHELRPQNVNADDPASRIVALPFLLIQTARHATVDIEISQDAQLVNVDFNGTQFSIRDDNYVLRNLSHANGGN